MRIPLRKFNRGLYFADPNEEIPSGSLIRARGIDKDTPWKSRQGSTALVSGNAHSITYFNDYYFYATGTAFYASTRAIAAKTGLSGNRLSYTRMAPRAGKADCLFVCGGGVLFKVLYDRYDICSTDDYLWNLSAAGTSEYYVTDSSGDNASFIQPITLQESSVALSTAALGSLATGTWNFGDNDTLGYNTVYVRLKDSTTANPGSHGLNYLELIEARASNWGITPPSHSPVASSGPAGGNLTGTYSYCCTFKNSRTGTRSNPSAIPSTLTIAASAVDSTGSILPVNTYSLLCHFNGAAGSTLTYDNSGRGHTITMYGNCDLDTTGAKYGTASAWFPGATGDYMLIEAHADWCPNYEPFTLDFYVNFDTLASTQYVLVSQGTTRTSDTSYWYLSYCHVNNRVYFFSKKRTGNNAQFYTGAWSWTPTTGTWYHLALVRGWQGDSEQFQACVDGSSLTLVTGYFSTTTAPVGAPGDTLRLGSWFYKGGVLHKPLLGHMDELRFISNAAAWTAGFTPSTGEYGAVIDTTSSIQYAAAGEKINLKNIPYSSDPQVDTVEIWRTQANGVAFFKLIEVANGQTTYLDNIPDDQLGLEECPIDNIIPYAWFDDCIGPHNASMFWITRNKVGERGRLYYSAIGRAETMEGFIEVSSDDDPLQKLVYYQGMLGVFSQSRFFQILGTNPYFVKEVSGVPGTIRPHSVAATPYGVAYEASDKTFRLLSGLSAMRFDEAIARILAGEAIENLKAWGGGSSTTVACYARGEYIISDSSQTLAYAFENKRWRDLGLACTMLFYNDETDQLLATVGSNILEVEKYGENDDNGTGIPYDVQTASVLLSDDKKGLIQHVHVDVDTNGETLGVKLVYNDGSTKSLGTITATSRTITTLPVNTMAYSAGIRTTGTLSSGTVYLYGIDMDVYIPGEEKE